MSPRMVAWGWALVLTGLGLGACTREPADLAGGHVTWLDGAGQPRYALRAKPYGFRVLAAGSTAWGRIERQPGEARLTSAGHAPVVAQRTPEGLQTKDADGTPRARLQVTPAGLVIRDRGGATVGRLALATGGATVAGADGAPRGSVRASGGALVQRRLDGAVLGTLLGVTDPLGAALLMLEDLPLEDRLALLALRLEQR